MMQCSFPLEHGLGSLPAWFQSPSLPFTTSGYLPDISDPRFSYLKNKGFNRTYLKELL